MDFYRESTSRHDLRHQPPASDGMKASLPWWRRITVRFEVLIASVVVLAMLLLTALMAYQLSTTASHVIMAASVESAQRISQLIGERVHRIVGPADATLRLLAFDPVTTAPRLAARVHRLPVLVRLLEQNPLLSAVYVGYSDGQFLLVRPLRDAGLREKLGAPHHAAFLLQSMAKEQGGEPLVGRWSFYDTELKLLATSIRPEYHYDPRTRPWYTEAVQTKTQILTAPYIFFTTQEVGVTLSQPSEEGRAVLGLDVALTDLGREIGGLRPMPRTEIAVVNKDHRVLAYPDMSRVLQRDGDKTRLRPLNELGVPSLMALQELDVRHGESRRFVAQGEEWLGQVQPLQSTRWNDLQLLMSIPTAELHSDLNRDLRHQVLWSLGLLALLLPLGWMAGRRVGRYISGLTAQAHSLARFDFQRPQRPASPVREVRDLGLVMDRMSDTIQDFLHITHHISAESRLDVMLSSVLYKLVQATGCSGGAVYMVDTERNRLVRTARYCEDPQDQARYPHELGMVHFIHYADRQAEDDDAAPDEPDVPAQQVLRVQLHTRDRKPLGLLVLRHAQDQRRDGGNFRAFVEKLSGTLSVAIETRHLIEGQRELFDAIILVLAHTIDTKSHYTGGHCERVPQLAEALMQRICDAQEGPFAEFSMTEAELYEFRLGAWLHDVGKVTSPEHIIDKATKLETIYNRIHEVRMRFEVLWRDAELDYWQQCAAGADTVQLQAELLRKHAQLQEDFAFVARSNVGGEFMADVDVQRLQAIGSQMWQRHFDDRTGLSQAEAARLSHVPQRTLPATEFLLADRPEHIVPWGARRPPVEAGNPANQWGFDMVLPPQEVHLGELHNLAIRRGTLTAEDRFKINDHIVQTIIMLRGLPFPPHLARVPAIAGSHHEKLDGTGYPRRLKGDELTLADRVMTLADIFEALTASDRPYKPPKTLSESLAIMAGMVRNQHIDAQVFSIFLRGGVWRDYAERFLPVAQRDAVDLDAIERLLTVEPSDG